MMMNAEAKNPKVSTMIGQERWDVVRFLSNLPAFKNVSLEKITEGLGSSGDHIVKSRIKKLEYNRHDKVWEQGQDVVHDGLYYVYKGLCRLSRKIDLAPLRDSLRGKDTGSSMQKDFEIATVAVGGCIGDESMLGGSKRKDSAKAESILVLIYIPCDYFAFGSRFADSQDTLVAHLRLRRADREARYQHLIIVFGERLVEPDDTEEKISFRKVKSKNGVVMRPVMAASEHAKRYFTPAGYGFFTGGKFFQAGQVPILGDGSDETNPLTNHSAISFLQQNKLPEVKPSPHLARPALPPRYRAEFPQTRVNRLYGKLWSQCSRQTWDLLNAMQEEEEARHSQMQQDHQPQNSETGETSHEHAWDLHKSNDANDGDRSWGKWDGINHGIHGNDPARTSSHPSSLVPGAGIGLGWIGLNQQPLTSDDDIELMDLEVKARSEASQDRVSSAEPTMSVPKLNLASMKKQQAVSNASSARSGEAKRDFIRPYTSIPATARPATARPSTARPSTAQPMSSTQRAILRHTARVRPSTAGPRSTQTGTNRHIGDSGVKPLSVQAVALKQT